MRQKTAIVALCAFAVLVIVLGVAYAFDYGSYRRMVTAKAAMSGAVICRVIVMDADGTLVCIPKE